MSQIVIISGSPTPGSRLNGVIQHVESIWAENGIRVKHIRVAELPAEELPYANFKDEKTLEALALV